MFPQISTQLSVTSMVADLGEMDGQEDVFGCLLDGVRVSICCGICTLTNTRSLFSTEIKKAFKHSRNCYLACFRYPAVQVMFHETYKNGKVSIFCKCSCIFFSSKGCC